MPDYADALAVAFALQPEQLRADRGDDLHVEAGALDLAGDGLHRRGYRIKPTQAPLRESVAAYFAEIQATGKLQQILDQHTDVWGIKVSAVEVKHVDLPDNMQRAMARQAEAAIAEAGAFFYMDPGIKMETIFGDGSQAPKGVLDALLGAGKRILTGESLFMTVFTNQGGGKHRVAFAAPYAGKILAMDLARHANAQIGDHAIGRVPRRELRGKAGLGQFARGVSREQFHTRGRRGAVRTGVADPHADRALGGEVTGSMIIPQPATV